MIHKLTFSSAIPSSSKYALFWIRLCEHTIFNSFWATFAKQLHQTSSVGPRFLSGQSVSFLQALNQSKSGILFISAK